MKHIYNLTYSLGAMSWIFIYATSTGKFCESANSPTVIFLYGQPSIRVVFGIGSTPMSCAPPFTQKTRQVLIIPPIKVPCVIIYKACVVWDKGGGRYSVQVLHRGGMGGGGRDILHLVGYVLQHHLIVFIH